MFSLYWNHFTEVLIQLYDHVEAVICVSILFSEVFLVQDHKPDSPRGIRGVTSKILSQDDLTIFHPYFFHWVSKHNTNIHTKQYKHTTFSCQLKWTHSPFDQCYLGVTQCQTNRKWRVQHGNNTNNQVLLLRYANHNSFIENQKLCGCRERERGWLMWW